MRCSRDAGWWRIEGYWARLSIVYYVYYVYYGSIAVHRERFPMHPS